MIENLLYPLMNPSMLFAVTLGTLAGVYVGAIPGLTGTMAVSLLVSLTFSWSTNVALGALIGVYVGVVFGGSRSAILLNIPGAPAAVADVFDGYPLAKKGKAAYAMGVATTESVVGTVVGVAALIFTTPIVSKVALNFSPVDYFLLAIMGVLMIGALGRGSMIKGLIAACIGTILGRIGQDAFTGIMRFTFGSRSLMAGIPSVVAMIGLYGFAEALSQVSSKDGFVVKQDCSRIAPELKTVYKHMPLALRCSVIGTIIGALPGSGGTIASLLAYQHAENSTKNPEVPFGEGAIEGIVAPESSNNAAVAGAFIPMLTLGVPGDGITAIIMSALIVHGMNPGPLLMTKSPDVFYITCALLLIAGFLLLPFGLTGIKVFAKFVEIPKGRLFPTIVILGVTGAYVSNNLLLHIAWMMAFGIMGYLLKKYDFPASPLTLGIVMGSLLEDNWRNAFLTFNGVGGIVQSIFTRPITFILFLVVIWTLVNKTRSYLAAVAVIKGSFRKLFSGVKQ
jgi:putative tricarboxylic transport membrane protein